MEYYNINTADLFLYTLCNVFQVYVVVIKSNIKDSCFDDLTGYNNENWKKVVLYKDYVATH